MIWYKYGINFEAVFVTMDGKALVAALVYLSSSLLAMAAPAALTLDASQSFLKVWTYKKGMLAKMAHDLCLSVTRWTCDFSAHDEGNLDFFFASCTRVHKARRALLRPRR